MTRTRRRVRSGVAAAAMLCVGASVGTAFGAPVGVAGQTPPAAAPDTLIVPARAVLAVDSASLLVGGAIRVLGGSTDDPEGQEGAAAVLALALDRILAAELAGTTTTARVAVDREALTVRFLASPDVWRSATERIVGTVFAPLSPGVLERARDDHANRLRFETGAPVRDFQERRFAALFGTTSGWARPSRGTVDSVERIDLSRLADHLVGAERDERKTFVALTGPFDRHDASELLAAFSTEAPSREAGPEAAGPEAAGPPARLPATRAWDDGFQEWIPMEITSVWVSVGFPAHSDSDRDGLALLAHHVREYLTPIPARPGIVAPRVELLEAPRGPVLLVTFAVAPEDAETWARRVAEVVRLEREAPPDDRFFAWERRRFRAAYRGQRASPEEHAHFLARERSVGWTGRSTRWLAGVEIADLEAAAENLGPVRILLYGPLLTER